MGIWDFLFRRKKGTKPERRPPIGDDKVKARIIVREPILGRLAYLEKEYVVVEERDNDRRS